MGEGGGHNGKQMVTPGDPLVPHACPGPQGVPAPQGMKSPVPACMHTQFPVAASVSQIQLPDGPVPQKVERGMQPGPDPSTKHDTVCAKGTIEVSSGAGSGLSPLE